MKKILMLIVPLTILTVIAMAFGLQENNEEIPTETKIQKVKTIRAKVIDHQTVVFASGLLASEEEMKLSFKTGGIIQKIYVNEGQHVKKGQLLAKLNLNEISAQAQQAQIGQQQAQINIDNAKIALKIAERDYRNAMGLYKDSVATLEQLENAELQVENAKNQLEAAEAGLNYNQKNIQIADFNVNYSKIVAPANGIILKQVAESNELVGSGTPVFIFGSKDKAQVIRVNLTDKDIININFGDKAGIQFDAYPDHEFQGEVKEIASMADPYTGTFEVEIEVNSEGKKLLSGFIGKVKLYTKESNELIQIPIDALVSADKSTGYIFTVQDTKAIKTFVQVQGFEQNQLLITGEIKDGQEVVLTGASFLQDGETVAVAND